jgi:hypothetical protein
LTVNPTSGGQHETVAVALSHRQLDRRELAPVGVRRRLESRAGALGTSGAEPSAIALETSSQSITVTNNAGKPIEDVRVAIHPIGSAPPYTSTLRRLENGEKRELSLAQFRSNDGTTFNSRFAKAKQVSVTATDIVGKKHELTKAWPTDPAFGRYAGRARAAGHLTHRVEDGLLILTAVGSPTLLQRRATFEAVRPRIRLSPNGRLPAFDSTSSYRRHKGNAHCSAVLRIP